MFSYMDICLYFFTALIFLLLGAYSALILQYKEPSWKKNKKNDDKDIYKIIIQKNDKAGEDKEDEGKKNNNNELNNTALINQDKKTEKEEKKSGNTNIIKNILKKPIKENESEKNILKSRLPQARSVTEFDCNNYGADVSKHIKRTRKSQDEKYCRVRMAEKEKK